MVGDLPIQMVDLQRQYLRLKPEMDEAIQRVLDSSRFIQGPVVRNFEKQLSEFLGGVHTVSCANGTDALQLALMALELTPGDEVIVPAFTYAATAEVIAILGLTPVICDVDPETFNSRAEDIRPKISSKTKAIIVVHLFGQCSAMDEIHKLAEEFNLFLIEDNAQSLGAQFTKPSGQKVPSGTLGIIGTTSFFPSKNLGCYGDGGALFTKDKALANKLRMMANHGQSRKYIHDLIGCNSRLDTIQAAVLTVKLKHLPEFESKRKNLADYYDEALGGIPEITTPFRAPFSSHVFHQYTLKVEARHRDPLAEYLRHRGIPTAIYYPVPLYQQEAFRPLIKPSAECKNTERLCREVLSLPMHTEMTPSQAKHITDAVKSYFAIQKNQEQ